MRHRSVAPLAVSVTLLAASHTSAGISAFWFPVGSGDGSVGATYPAAAVTGPNGDPQLLGMQTWDLRVVTDGNWAVAGLRATLPSGGFYNHSLGSNTSPNPAFFSIAPAIEFDTYITAPGDVGAASAPSILGGFPEGQPVSMSGSTFSVHWGDLTNDAPWLYRIARLTYPLGTAPAIHPQSFTSQVTPDATVTAPNFRVSQHDRWLPDADGSWHDVGNWTLGRPPLDGDTATIDVGGPGVRTITYSQGTSTLSGLTSHEHLLLTGGLLRVAGPQLSAAPLTITNGLTVSGGTLQARVVGSPVTIGPAGGRLFASTLAGGLVMPGGAPLIVNGLGLESNGTLSPGAVMRFESLGLTSLHGTGTLHFAGGGVLEVDGGATLHVSGTTLRGRGGTIGVRTPGTNGQVRISSSGRIIADVNGGSMTVVADELYNSGTLTAGAGAVLLLDAPLKGHGRVGGAGAVRALRGLTVEGTLVKDGVGPLRVNGPLTIDNYRLNLSDGSVINDYDGASPLPRIRAKIIRGYNGGAWNGPGINSSTAAQDPTLGIGYAEATELFTSFPAAFAGETIDQSTLILRLVRYGDADLDGAVDLQDFNRLAANFGHAAAGWSQGDFNYDLIVDLHDFNRLASNFGMSVAGSGVTTGDWAALASRVPEPACAWVACVSALSARRRRR